MQIWTADSGAQWKILDPTCRFRLAAFFEFGPDGYSLFRYTNAILGRFSFPTKQVEHLTREKNREGRGREGTCWRCSSTPHDHGKDLRFCSNKRKGTDHVRVLGLSLPSIYRVFCLCGCPTNHRGGPEPVKFSLFLCHPFLGAFFFWVILH